MEELASFGPLSETAMRFALGMRQTTIREKSKIGASAFFGGVRLFSEKLKISAVYVTRFAPKSRNPI